MKLDIKLDFTEKWGKYFPGSELPIACFYVNVERYKKSPAHVKAMFKNSPSLKAGKKYLVFKRWDSLTGSDHPRWCSSFAPRTSFRGCTVSQTMTP